MIRRELADGYYVSPVITGGWQLSESHNDAQSGTPVDDLQTYFEAGFTTFDCADHYTGVEELLGQFRDQYNRVHGYYPATQIHTKYVPNRAELESVDRGDVEEIIDRSRVRLGIGALDLVQYHWWDYGVDRYVETAEHLIDLQREGKIRRIGTTNFDVPHLRELVAAGIPVVSQQAQYSILDRRPKRNLIEFCESNGVKLLAYGTLAGGFLTDRYLGAAEPEPPFENRSLTKYKLIIDEAGDWTQFQSLLKALSTVAERHEASIANVATRYVLDQPQVCSVVVGARDVSHLEDNRRVFELELDAEDIEMIEQARAELDEVPGGVYELERETDRHARIMNYNSN